MCYIVSIPRTRLFKACTVGVMLLTMMGCSSESRRVCDHLRTLAEASTQHNVRNKDYSRCIKEARASLSEDPDEFHIYTTCLLRAKSLDEASACTS